MVIKARLAGFLLLNVLLVAMVNGVTLSKSFDGDWIKLERIARETVTTVIPVTGMTTKNGGELEPSAAIDPAVPSVIEHRALSFSLGFTESYSIDLPIIHEPSAVPTALDLGSFSFSFELSKEPSAAPSAVPSAVPTAPGFGSFSFFSRFSSQLPTMAPSTSVSPTSAPTEIPTAMPSGILPVFPSAIPSRAPTFDPTVAPTAVPSVSRTTAPTDVSTYRPTPGPGEPTLSPTRKPTSSPTFRPTPRPSTPRPSRMPTMKPSRQTAPIVNFPATVVLGGYTSPNVTDEDIASVHNATAEVMSVPLNALNFRHVDVLLDTARRSSSNTFQRDIINTGWSHMYQGLWGKVSELFSSRGEGEENEKEPGLISALDSPTYSLNYLFDAIIPLQTTSFVDAEEYYEHLTALYDESTASGDFMDKFKAAAAMHGIIVPDGVSVDDAFLGLLKIIDPPEDDDNNGYDKDEDDGLPNWAVVLIILLSTSFLCCVLVAISCFLTKYNRKNAYNMSGKKLYRPSSYFSSAGDHMADEFDGAVDFDEKRKAGTDNVKSKDKYQGLRKGKEKVSCHEVSLASVLDIELGAKEESPDSPEESTYQSQPAPQPMVMGAGQGHHEAALSFQGHGNGAGDDDGDDEDDYDAIDPPSTKPFSQEVSEHPIEPSFTLPSGKSVELVRRVTLLEPIDPLKTAVPP